jgi:hypothetical protein
MGSIAALIMAHYLNRENKFQAFLSPEKVAEINQHIKEWNYLALPDKPCHMGRQFCFVFNLKFRRPKIDNIISLTQKYCYFITWLKNFITINHIEFPHIEVFFIILIFNNIGTAKLIEDSKYKFDFDLIKIQRLIDFTIEKNEDISLLADGSSSCSTKQVIPNHHIAIDNVVKEHYQHLSDMKK